MGFVARAVQEQQDDGSERLICRAMNWRSVREGPVVRPDDLAQRPVSEDILWDLRHDPFANLDNCRLDDLQTAVDEVQRFADLGGRTILEATGLGEQECTTALADSGGDLKVALVHLLSGVPTERAAAALEDTNGHVRNALDRLAG